MATYEENYEEITTGELDTTVEEQGTEVISDPENPGSGLLTKVIIGAGVLAVGGIVLARKFGHKIDDWRVRHLEKKGYKILPPAPPTVDAPAEIPVVEADVVDPTEEE